MRLNRFKSLILGLALAVAIPATLSAASGDEYSNYLRGRLDQFTNVGNRAATFLTIPVGARGLSMGSAFVAQADDISAIYWNPAGLGFIEGPQAFLNHVEMPLDFSLDYMAAALPMLEGKMVIGGFFGIMNIGEEEITTVESPEGTGAYYDGYSLQFGGTVAYNFSDRFSAGVSVKYVQESIYELTSNALAFDMGTNYHTEFFEKPIRLSFVISNLGTNMQFTGDKLFLETNPEEIYSDRLQDGAGNRIFPRDNRDANYRTSKFSLPTSFVAGIAMDPYVDNYNRWTLAGQFQENNYAAVSYAVGTEYNRILSDKFTGSLRWGWYVDTDEDDGAPGQDDSMKGMSFGGGIDYQLIPGTRLSLDYAYRDMGLLDENHYFTLMLKMY